MPELITVNLETGTMTMRPFTPPAPVITPEMLTAELDRRLSLGFNFDFGDERGVHHFGTTPKDMERWIQEVTPLAQAFINMENPDGRIGIKTETGPVTISASEWQLILSSAAKWRQPLYAAYFALKSLHPIPADFSTNQTFWPS